MAAADRHTLSVQSATGGATRPAASSSRLSEPRRRGRSVLPPWRLLACVLLTSALSVFPSYYFSVINVATEVFHNFTEKAFDDDYGVKLDEAGAGTVFGFTVAIYNVGMLLGSLSVGTIADRLGRRLPCMVYTNVLAVVAELLMAFSWVDDSWRRYEMFMVGRLLSGAATGLSYGLLSMYLSEISPPEYRGFNGSCENLMISLNTLFSLFVALPEALGTVDRWIWLHAIGVPFALLQIALTPFFPETPKYLLLNKGDEPAARKALKFFNPDMGERRAAEVLTHFRGEELEQSCTGAGLGDMFRRRELLRPLLVSCAVIVATVSTGIVAIFTYSTVMFQKAGVPDENAKWASILMSACNTAGALGANLLIERLGRRTLMLFGLTACACATFAFMCLDLAFYYLEEQAFAYAGIVAMLVHVTVFNVGPGAIMWFYVAEINPQATRGKAVTICQTLNGIVIALLNVSFEPFRVTLNSFAYMFFFVPTAAFTVFLYKVLPETKDKEVDEIMEVWKAADFSVK